LANKQFKVCSIGSKFTKFSDKNDRLFFNFEKFVKNEALFDQYFTNIYVKKTIVYWVQTFGIWVTICSDLIQNRPIVCDRPNITVT
jgi:hypothetical protein